MSKLKIFCITLNPSHLDLIKKIGYEPVGLGDASFNNEWIQDKIGDSIHFKNANYGEYTFHYWLWKNQKINLNFWIGFCQYRKFWLKKKIDDTKHINSINSFVSTINLPLTFWQYPTISRY